MAKNKRIAVKVKNQMNASSMFEIKVDCMCATVMENVVNVDVRRGSKSAYD